MSKYACKALTYLLPSRRAGARELAHSARVEGGYCSKTLFVALFALIMITSPLKANADMNLKLYAYNLMSWSQFECYNWLIHKESSWNPKAVNGSHYGLGQMRSRWYKDLDPYKQIKVHMKYLSHRYGGDACKALAHLERKGWH